MVLYTVMIVPLRSNIDSLDGLRFFLWVKKLQELERKKDFLWMSLQQPVWSRSDMVRSKLEGNVKTDKMAEASVEHDLESSRTPEINTVLKKIFKRCYDDDDEECCLTHHTNISNRFEDFRTLRRPSFTDH